MRLLNRQNLTPRRLLLAALAACVLFFGSAYAHNELQRFRAQERQRVRREYEGEIRRRMAQGKTYKQAADEVIREEMKTQRHKRGLLARLLDY